MESPEIWLLSYFILVNLYAWLQFGIDKWKAVNNRWRIPEKVLLTVAGAGGSLGAWVGMQMFHHKTRDRKFSIGVPLFFVLHVLLVIGFFWYRHM